MKISFLVFIWLLFSVFCSAQSNVSHNVSSEIPVFQTEAYLKILSSDKMEGRESGTAGYVRATKFVSAILKNTRLLPVLDNTYSDSVIFRDYLAPNLLAKIPGTTDSLIILGAHLDHVGKKNNKIYNGANDNATGVVALLQIAEYLNNHLQNNRATILILFFTAEEHGLLGSNHLASVFHSADIPIKYMLNFEMLGNPIKENNKGKVYLVEHKGVVIKEYLNITADKPFIETLPSRKNNNIFARSDNASFAEFYDIPCVTFTCYNLKNYDHYHKHTDTFSNIDIEHLNLTINRLAKSIYLMIENNIKVY